MIEAQLIDVGRNKINKVVKVKNTKALHAEIKKHILSPGWGLEQSAADPCVYNVTTGWNVVGIVIILSED